MRSAAHAPGGGLAPYLALIAGIACLSAMDATIKQASLNTHTLFVAFGRYAFGALFAAMIWAHAGRPAITADMWRAHGLRGIVIACSGTAFFWSLTVLPLAEAVTYSFFYPLIVPFAAALIVGERVRFANMAAIALGFAGVLVALSGAPSPAQSPQHALGVAAAIFSALTFSIAVAMMRARARTDGAAIVGLLATLIPGLIVLGPALAFAPAPRWADWPIFLLMGAFGAAGMYCVARAYAAAEAQRLAPVHYTELLWASLIGYFLFQETPRPQIFVGALIIIAACLWTAWDARRITARQGLAS